jgi:hypothetical protein
MAVCALEQVHDMVEELFEANWIASSIAGLTHFHRATDYEPALVLARKLTRWTIDHGTAFAPDGRYLHEPIKGTEHSDDAAAETLGTRSYAHFHGHTIILLALLECGLQVGDPSHQTTERVLERNIGGFAAHAAANDFSTGKTAITACCTGNGARWLYQAWEHILDYIDDRLKVDLLLNRASPWADVDSYVLYEGRVDVKVKRDCELSLRIPEWVEPEQVTCRVDEAENIVGWEGRYAQVGWMKEGQIVALSFPMLERTHRIYIQKHRYTLLRKRNDVVSVRPGGQYLPLYQREHYRHREVRWRTIERFVPEKGFAW